MPFQPLPCEAIIFRVARKSSQFDKERRRLKTEAFLRYRNRDEDGLSVFLGEVDSCEKAAQQLSKTFGVGTLHVGKLRDIQVPGNEATLDVVQDDEDHGIIDRLPFWDDDPESAEFIATVLYDHARTCWP